VKELPQQIIDAKKDTNELQDSQFCSLSDSIEYKINYVAAGFNENNQ
jgi:hypothetical protein